jgi:hypothetical protein
MTRKKVIAAVIVAMLLVVAALLLLHKKHDEDLLPVRLTAIQTTKGWGYEIFVDGKIFIKQETLPAVTGDRSFRSKEEALVVGNLAVEKIVRGKMPAITTEELRSLKVLE